MDRDLSIGFASPDRHQQGLLGQVRGRPRLCRPADDTSREQVDDDTKIQPSFVRSRVGDVGHPDLIRRGRLEPLLQPILSHNGGLATIPAGSPPIADLSRGPGKRGQACDTVLRNAFTLIAQIVGQLALTIDSAAVDPGIPDQVSLACVFLRTVA